MLDPFAFWIIPGERYGVDYAIFGITGAFVVLGQDHDGYVKVGMGRATAGGQRVQGFSKLKRAERLFGEQLSGMNIHLPQVEGFVCFTRATIGQPRKFKSVWMANPADMRKLIAER